MPVTNLNSRRIQGYDAPPERRDDRQDDDAPISERAAPRSRDVEEAFAELGIKSFRQEFRRLAKLSGDDDFSSSRTAYALLRSQLAMVINAMPLVEEAAHRYRSDRAIYAMAALITCARELGHDLRAFGDQSELADRLRRDVLQGVLQSLATEVVSDLIDARKDARSGLSAAAARRVDDALRRHQEKLTAIFARAEESAAALLARVLAAR